MIKLESYIKLTKEDLLATNLCHKFSDKDLDTIGSEVHDGYERDQQSRRKWLRRNEAGMNLAMQILEGKNFPWQGCSNIAFPLITIASQQFHARAYPSTVQGTSVVKYRIIGADPDNSKRAYADKISTHMSYQFMEEDAGWEEQQDKLLINLSVVGSNFMKTYYNGRHNTSELVMAKHLVLDYSAKSVEECPRKTHILPMYRNELHERIMKGQFRDVTDEGWYESPPQVSMSHTQQQADNRKGQQAPPTADDVTPFQMLEQHVAMDLDGDGYAEPYIITIEEYSKCVLRIVTRYDREEDVDRVAAGPNKGKIIKIYPMEYFTKYEFLPSPDGGIYGMGFGVLLGPLNEAVNSLINQLVDAGTMATTAGGFLGRGAKIRGGAYTFAPLEWKRVDTTGDDLHKSIFPLPVREPSAVLFQLLSLLINYTNRISGTTDTMVGENPGQNTPAETTRTMVEMGQKIYGAIYKRIWRSRKEEFKKAFRLNSIYLPLEGGMASRQDYMAGDPTKVRPVADPNILSDGIELQQAVALKQAAMSTAGYDKDAVEHIYLKALKIENIEQVYPGIKVTGPMPNPKVQVEQMKMQIAQAKLQQQQMEFVQTLQEEARVNAAQIILLQAQASKALAEAGEVKAGHEVAQLDAMIAVAKLKQEDLHKRVDLLMHNMELSHDAEQGRLDRVAGPPGDAAGQASAGAAT